MPLKAEFFKEIQKCLENNCDLLELRICLVDFRKRGMSKAIMTEALEALRADVKPENVDTVLELLDFVVGFCNTDLAVFE